MTHKLNKQLPPELKASRERVVCSSQVCSIATIHCKTESSTPLSIFHRSNVASSWNRWGGRGGRSFAALCRSRLPKPPPLSASIAAAQVDDRAFLKYTPKDLPAGSPLVIVLHGSNSSGAQMRAWCAYLFDQYTDQDGFAVVYPEAYKGTWNDLRKAAPFPSKREGIDDVGFIRRVIETMHDAHDIDKTRVFAFGYSNGAQLAFRLALEEPCSVRGIACVAANLPLNDNNLCRLDGPTVPVMLFNGTADPIIPFQGGEVTLFGFASRGFVQSAAATAADFARRNGLYSEPAVLTTGAIKRYTWARADHPHIVQYIIAGGGHVIPQPLYRFPRLLGSTSYELNASAEAMRFFLGR
ncbi:Alpha/Beta hydrolase protein [Mycena haematopus]|nr:Alpha/Beta hydrolase protein [Mycena haematopus]